MIRFVPRAAGEGVEIPGYPFWMSRLLSARSVSDAAEAEQFLHPDLAATGDPFFLNDMDKAVSLLREIREKGVRTVVYGDYDADGVCATAILCQAFSRFGISVGHYLPDRREEGYGLNAAAVEKLAKAYGALVTVDCGITSSDEIALAKKLGMTVIVTDHHTPPDTPPPADAVVHPALGGRSFPFLCGAGVAWQTARALLSDAGEWLDLCALATIADMVPLTGENRALAYVGLKALTNTKRAGLIALKKIAGLTGEVTGEHAAFALAPRLNASGRMESAESALNLLLTDDPEEAKALAERLDGLNKERRRVEDAVLDAAEGMVARMDLTARRAIVLCGGDFPSGVVGLAAGRIAEKYGYPTVVMTREGDNAVGSARSAAGVDIYEALKEENDLFLRFGGHKQAAGLTLPYDKLDEFDRRLSDAVDRQLGGRAPVPTMAYDGEMTLSDFTLETVDRIAALAPFGVGNPTPKFLVRALESLDLRPVGENGKHLRVAFLRDGEIRNGVMFGGGEYAAPAGMRYAALAAPSRNEYKGRESAEMRVYALALEPDSARPTDFDLLAAWLPDIAGNEAATPLDALPDLNPQGDLMLCRARDTALALKKAHPDADFLMDAANDARAYTAVAVRLSVRTIKAPYKRVFLCDGDYGETEAIKKSLPDARVYALKRADAANGLLARAFVDKDGLREAYKAAREGAKALSALAERAELPPEMALSALYVLKDVRLISFTYAPFSLHVLSSEKTDPEQCARCRLLQAVKEEIHGEHGI